MQRKIKGLFIVTGVFLVISVGIVTSIYIKRPLPRAENFTDITLTLGQNMIVGIPGPNLDETIKGILHKIKPGGIVLYRRNYQSDKQFKSLIQQLQIIAKEDSNVPYFIMIDEEPEGASRLDLLTNVFTLNLPDWGVIDQGVSKLADLGITVDLAPIADFPFNQDSFVKKRVPTGNLADLKSFNQTFIILLSKYNISATLKHFPGVGVFVEDPHKGMVNGYIKQEYFDQSVALFKSGIDAGVQFIMTSHAVYSNVDPRNPATLSRTILTELLREKMGFEGIIITDDIEDMLAPIWNIDPSDAGIRAIEAGNTMIMYGQSLEPTLATFKIIEEKIKKDQTLRGIVEGNYQKIIKFKNEQLLKQSSTI